MRELYFERTENTVRKRQNAGDHHFLPISQCFQELFSPKHLNSESFGNDKKFVTFIQAEQEGNKVASLGSCNFLPRVVDWLYL